MATLYYFLERASDRAVCAFRDTQGLSVPFFSTLEAARVALGKAGSEFGVGILPPDRVQSFAASCHKAGAATMRLDPPERELPEAGALTHLDLK